MESHNRYAVLATDIETVSIASSDKDGDVTESSTNMTTDMTTQKEQHRHQLHDSTHDDKGPTRRLDIKTTREDQEDSTAGASNGSPSTKDPALCNFGAKRHMSSLRGATQLTKSHPPSACYGLKGAPLSTPHKVLSKDKQAAPTQWSPITTIDIESRSDGAQENTARNPKDKNNVAGATTFSSILPRGIVPIAPSDVPMPKVAGQTGNSAFARVTIVPIAAATELDDTLQAWQFPHPDQKEHDEDHQARPLNTAGVANATAMKKIAIGKEFASAQAIERGHPVVMIEVPDHEDDTSFKLQQNKVAATDADACRPSLKRQSPLMEKEAECPIGNDTPVSKGQEAAKHVPSMVTPQEWLKPFETEWTWRAIKDTKDEKSSTTSLRVSIHQNAFALLTGWTNFGSPSDTLSEHKTPLLASFSPSGCTGSSIHRDLVKKHGIPVQKTASSIPVYNADGSCNKAGEITAYAELRLKIGNHSERIDLTVTDLGSKEIFLGHDWLVRHNPVINWTTGSVTFARCHCAKNRFILPDADPDDEWELEEGETILSVDFEEAIEIHAVHKANELAAKANKGKEKKTFEQLVPESYRDFKDLFTKENFDDLPVRKPWDHAIELVPNAKNMLDCKVYPLNPIEQKELDKFLDENLASGRIKPSKSPMASPFFFVKKKDGTLRPVQDYRKLNEMTIKN
ncbi:uncharacterized protein ARMOST_17693 [Armillaria ostoyae]|uniref:Reverse transcriptase/retrotransposon-derived protein RNase H-like domain-containing protein n=1 Tax=Armillaria ostoyae TaxID=47428 RepID=A0A284RZU3_ARMOS|nr:uncharacterized protein ARMOST_17693 [Armillaria ostoyae]